MKKSIIVKQRDSKDCGACCLSSIVQYYGGYIPLEKNKLDTLTTINGTSAFNIIAAAKEYGFDAKGVKCSDLDNKDLILPAIIHVVLKNNLNHFIVVYKILKDKVLVMDPAKGLYKISKQELIQIYSGHLILLVPKSSILKFEHNYKLSSMITNIIKEEKNFFQKSFFLTLVITVLSIIYGLFYETAMKYINNSKELMIILLCAILLCAITIILKLLKSLFQNKFQKKLEAKVTLSFLKHFFNLPLNNIMFHSNGELLTRFENLENINLGFIDIFADLLLNLILSILFGIVLFLISSKLFLILLAIIAIYTIIGLINGPMIYREINTNINHQSEYNSVLLEQIDGIQTIKCQSKTQATLKKISQYKWRVLDHTYLLNKLIIFYDFLKNSITEIGLTIIIGYGFILISRNSLNIVELMTFNLFLNYFFDPIRGVINSIPKYYYLKASFDKISDFLQMPEETIEIPKEFKNSEITIQKLTFYYNKVNLIFKNLNLKVNDKEHIFVAGSSGAGKSSICRLLMRIYDDYTGNILIGGVNIKDYNISTIRGNINYLSQSEKIFSGTIKENLLLGLNNEPDKINQVLRITHLKDVIDKLPFRLDTLVENDGLNLSGGERQRLILARCLLNTKPIMIFDEALSEVPNKMERNIIMQIKRYLNNSTIIYISHRNNSDLFNRKIYIDKKC